MIGERVGDWIIDAELAQDYKGRSYRAHAADDAAKLVTIKILSGGQSAEFLDLFRGRLLLLRKLAHPNLVTYLGGGTHNGDGYYVAEHVAGPDYQSLLRAGKRPAWTDVLSYALQSVSALRHAHRRSVLHGDLKPANLLVAADGKIKLAECGIARLYGAEVPPPGDNPLATAAFISPEQAAGKPATKRSDFYSLGCLLYALLTGRPPFTATTLVELTRKQCSVVPERPGHFLPELPEEFEALVMKLLAKDPQVRPGSGTLLLAEFERVWNTLEARGQLSKRPALPTEDDLAAPAPEALPDRARKIIAARKPPRPVMSRPGIVIPLFLLCIGALIVGFYWSRTDPEELYAQAQPLMRSENPADWERAWTEYLEPLSREYPDRYAEEIKAFRARTEPLGELRKAQAAGRAAKYGSEAERFYQEGVRLCQAGNFAAARRTWERVALSFAEVESEKHWVELARQAVGRLTPQDGALRKPATAATIRAIIQRAKTMRAYGNIDDANAVWDALEALYRDDPDGVEIRELIRKERSS